MNESLLEYAVKRLKATKGNWPRVARAADIEYFWLVKLANGKLKNPSYHTVEKLAKYFKSIREEGKWNYGSTKRTTLNSSPSR